MTENPVYLEVALVLSFYAYEENFSREKWLDRIGAADFIIQPAENNSRTLSARFFVYFIHTFAVCFQQNLVINYLNQLLEISCMVLMLVFSNTLWLII